MSEKDLQKEIADLKAEVKRLKKSRLGLFFEEKSEEVVQQCQKQVPVLKEIIKNHISLGDGLTDNLLIEGDNYHSLSVLNYTHKGKIDLIYIDPPYNTGNHDFIYNDQYVDTEDEYRHSKWLSFMWNRLSLARDLLSPTGLIFISVDDNEQAHLRVLCDKIFGASNYRATIVVRGNPRGRDYGGIARTHDYILVYSKTQESKILSITEEGKEFPYEDKRGGFEVRELRNRNIAFNINNRPNLYYPFYINSEKELDNGFFEISLEKKKGLVELFPKESQGEKTVWRWGKPRSQTYLNTEIVAKKMKDGGYQIVEKYRKKEKMARSIWDDKDVNTEKGTLLVKEMLGEKIFAYPKPVEMIMRIVEMASATDDITVLDFFAGSGTTGHAVLKLNAEDGGNRKFIICTNNEDNNRSGKKIATDICYPRIKKAIKGFGDTAGIPSNLFYYQTDLVDIDQIKKVSDDAKVRITYQAGEMIAVREDTLNEVEENEWWQIFESKGKMTAIYFKEDKSKLEELITKLEKKNLPVALYIFSWGKNEYKGEYSSPNIRVEDIPEPIIEVYKELNRL
ncbi:site-specific DNA-methyltransferase [Candidatus Kaiserbacteria bacterium CG10_big_fil_rev_8_21_14_0_10_43_70]|uniref:Site-specific DNA-methyltransferase n=1 Tax=Candidatus Kaiserbacteria bacterium CG10_big_fil_rev_8_21_14_0_10_43_70 TaxID=1974605 RepID=A0A2H0UKZ6_9BACT|nr:MAG: site-specific DNA-methyltransferase [Candidatus Kaiserbacteria bacterium CG10_big_fil_rev_8_21_14_0_10_43_70]